MEEETPFAKDFMLSRRFILVTCPLCDDDSRCKSCSAWQAFIFRPTIVDLIYLKNHYFVDYDTDMIILVSEFDRAHGKEAPLILERVGLTEIFDFYRNK